MKNLDFFIIYNQNGRNLHLSFSALPAEEKIKDERLEEFPFCLLFRHAAYWDLEKKIKKSKVN